MFVQLAQGVDSVLDEAAAEGVELFWAIELALLSTVSCNGHGQVTLIMPTPSLISTIMSSYLRFEAMVSCWDPAFLLTFEATR